MQASLPSPLRELTCHMRSHSVTCHPAEVTFPQINVRSSNENVTFKSHSKEAGVDAIAPVSFCCELNDTIYVHLSGLDG